MELFSRPWIVLSTGEVFGHRLSFLSGSWEFFGFFRVPLCCARGPSETQLSYFVGEGSMRSRIIAQSPRGLSFKSLAFLYASLPLFVFLCPKFS